MNLLRNTRFHPPTRRKARQEKGFAIIVTLTLMALLLVVVMGILSLASISARQAERQISTMEAQDNARMAVMLALGELQRTAGPDQRITGRADLLDDDIPHPLWTAVWNADPAIENPAYLVSGNELRPFDLESNDDHPPGYHLPNTALDPATSVRLFNDPTTPNAEVRAPLVELMTPTPGAYAYWVADEGVKARFNVANPYREAATDDEKQLAVTTSQSNGIAHVSDELALHWPDHDMAISRAATHKSGELIVPAVEGYSEKYFNHLTAYSRGLLVDVKNGGLKRDLTLAFEDEDVFFNWFGRRPESESFGGVVSEGGYEKDINKDKFFISDVFHQTSYEDVGPNWGTMKHYYNLHKKSGDTYFDLIFQHPMAGIDLRRTDWNPYTSHREPSISPQWGTDLQHTNNYVAPIPSRVQAGYRLTGLPSTSANHPDTIVLELEFKPLLGLWNPYNVTFRPNVFKFDWEMVPFLEIEISGNTAPSNSGGAPMNGTIRVNMTDWYGSESAGNQFVRLETRTPADLQPGEFRMFSVTRRDRMQWRRFRMGHSGSGVTGVLEPTWGVDGYFRMVLPEQFDEPSRGDSFKPLRLSPDATVKVHWFSLSKREQTAGAAEWDNTAGNFFTFKPGNNGTNHASISPFRATNFWQPGVEGMAPEAVEDLPPRSASSLVELPQELATWAFTLRQTTGSPGQNIRNFVDGNVRALNFNSRWDGSVEGMGMTALSPFRGEGYQGRGLLPPGSGEPQADGNRYRMFGGDGNQTHVATFDIPHRRPLSLGAFQHAVLARYNNEPSFVLGNSYANPRVPLAQTVNPNFLSGTNAPPLVTYDTSYLVNENVWDGYFLSGLSPDNTALPPADFTEIARNERPAPNSRVVVLDPGLTKDQLISPEEPAASEIGGKLAIEGAFNVNSTSVEAWRAVLAGMSGLEMPVFDPIANGPTQWRKSGGVTFSRFSRNPGEEEDFWMGYLTLDDTQLDNLAKEIVNQVRLRGPFRNLGDFVNRSLTPAANPSSSDTDIRTSGALQAALDHENTGINAAIPNTISGQSQNLEGNHFEPILDGGQQATGNAGFIMQGDILQAIAPIITVRSDTFVVRAYGNAKSPDGRILAETWCEAVFQRLPQPVDPTGTLSNPDAGAGTNFGRGFEMISFRWLPKHEIDPAQ